jgi:uncharacterized membrane protein YfcA
MLNSFIYAVMIGTVLGILSGLGTGGGSLLILWLRFVQNMSQSEARAINLLFFIPSALVACLFQWKQGKLDIKKVLPAIIAGSVSASVFAWIGASWDSQILQKAFGIFLLLTGIREFRYKQKER